MEPQSASFGMPGVVLHSVAHVTLDHLPVTIYRSGAISRADLIRK